MARALGVTRSPRVATLSTASEGDEAGGTAGDDLAGVSEKWQLQGAAGTAGSTGGAAFLGNVDAARMRSRCRGSRRCTAACTRAA